MGFGMDYKLRKTWLPLQLHKQRERGGEERGFLP